MPLKPETEKEEALTRHLSGETISTGHGNGSVEN